MGVQLLRLYLPKLPFSIIWCNPWFPWHYWLKRKISGADRHLQWGHAILREPLLLKPPPPHFNLLLSFWPLHFANMIKLFSSFAEKKTWQWRQGDPNFSRAPQFQFCPQISAFILQIWWKNFVEFCRKKVRKCRPYGAPNAIGSTYPLFPPGCTTVQNYYLKNPSPMDAM